MSEHLYIGTNGHVSAIDPASGAELWRTKLMSGIFSATVSQDVSVLDHGDKIFAGSNGHLFCLSAQTGEILWHNELEGLGNNDVTLTIGGRSIQMMHKTHQHHHN